MGKKKDLPRKDEMVIRSFGIPDIRAVGEGGVIEGHAAVYDQKTSIGDWFNEIIERGAFDGCDFDDVLFTANHELWDIPLARSRRNNSKSTLQLNLDDQGLFIRANLDIENNAEAKSLYSAVNREDITGMSFIFYVSEERWEDLDTDMPTRHILKIAKVREVSAVNYPAYTGTDINARNDQSALENAKKALENARSTLENEKSELELMKAKLNLI
ncbi:caudovirus prohead protease [Desulfosporosinus acididurans]|uniref:Caudovirus prohead protease n=1 Tax=Desulfosporosinus acididurans TaxID=476652 RepID=A0A0J1FTE7_9FIRM|nr:HK97 family phage prohead protease [Desulfosporosinus acididurans]KLU66749.1 caudovirus prohead protease [Desulfosporosinus acididurans]